MSGRGGIYEGPDGTKLYGDGQEVERYSREEHAPEPSTPPKCNSCGGRGHSYVNGDRVACMDCPAPSRPPEKCKGNHPACSNNICWCTQPDLDCQCYPSSWNTGSSLPSETAKKYEWWCANCHCTVVPEDVTFDETHDIRYGGCGEKVGTRPRSNVDETERARECAKELASLLCTRPHTAKRVVDLLVELAAYRKETV